jgi:Lung seven transmembrane receptor
VYALLLLWFYCLMRLHAESRIPIEKWILLTIGMGLVEMVLRVADYLDWNMDGDHSNALMYAGILMGVIKDGFSRGLLVMVSLGWGVIRDSLGLDLPKIVVLGIVYIACAAVLELTIAFAEQDIQSLSYDAEVELFDLATIFNFVVAAVNVVFIMWILDALNATMTYLDNMNQTRKLARYLRLRTILLFSVLFAVVWAVFSLVDTYDEDGIVREEHEWIVNAATELNYLAVLIGVAILWKPNPNAKEYAYVMELPAMGSDGETELELTDVVPSAMDDMDDDFNDDNGQPTNFRNGSHDDRFKIDDAELS